MIGVFDLFAEDDFFDFRKLVGRVGVEKLQFLRAADVLFRQFKQVAFHSEADRKCLRIHANLLGKGVGKRLIARFDGVMQVESALLQFLADTRRQRRQCGV